MDNKVFVHSLGLNESALVGAGTKIWAYSHVMKGAAIGKDCMIGEHVFIEAGVKVGDGVTVKNGVSVWEGVTLGDYVFVGPNVIFTNDMFPRSPRNPQVADKYLDRSWLVPTHVEFSATLGAGAIIICGVKIAEYAMVAAGAVVTKDVKAYQLVMGSPARVVGYVCRCGERLDEQYNCSVCLQKYRMADEGLIEA